MSEPQKNLTSTVNRLSQKWVPWLILGIALRFVLIPLSLHIDLRFIGDLIAMNHTAKLIIFDLTSPFRSPSLYPPLAYYTLGLFQILFSPFSTPIPLDIFSTQTAIDWLTNPFVFRQLFFLKIWYLVFDLGAAYLLWRMFRDDQKKARTILLFWLLNPIIIYNAYLHGQFDVVPIFFVVVALYLAKQERPAWAAFFIGIAACFKIYPLLFLIPTVLILSQAWRERLKLLFLGTVPYLIFLLPRLDEYLHTTSGFDDWFFRVGYDIGFGGQVYIFFALYAVLIWYIETKGIQGFEALWRVCFITLLIYYPFSYFDLHYYAWLMPFAALYLAENPKIIKLYLFAFLCLLIILFQTPVARFFSPISPKYFLRLPSLLEVLSPYLPILFIMNVFRSFLVGTLFWLAWMVLREISAYSTMALNGEEKT